jgi:hypothetical protein
VRLRKEAPVPCLKPPRLALRPFSTWRRKQAYSPRLFWTPAEYIWTPAVYIWTPRNLKNPAASGSACPSPGCRLSGWFGQGDDEVASLRDMDESYLGAVGLVDVAFRRLFHVKHESCLDLA